MGKGDISKSCKLIKRVVRPRRSGRGYKAQVVKINLGSAAVRHTAG